jgi:uncharacterized flavoprotein (TIGR03862 family)
MPDNATSPAGTPDGIMPGRAPHVVVVGAGPAGLMAADVLSTAGAAVTVYDRMASVGRKLLLAGRGGLNLTHSEDLERLLARYGAAEPHLRAAILAFGPGALRAWSEQLGQATFVGSSGRVFPAALKASPLLRTWLRRLRAAGVTFALRRRWTGWDAAGRVTFEGPDGAVAFRADATVLALGGASWPRLGSDGAWADILRAAGVAVAPLVPANCGFATTWSPAFVARFEGRPLKRIALAFGDRRVRGEAMITRAGLEGGAIYGLSASVRDAIAANGDAVVMLDLRPDLALPDLRRRLETPRRKQSLSTWLRKVLRLDPAAIGLLHEAAGFPVGRLAAMSAVDMAALVKAVPVRLVAAAPIERAISTAGGVAFGELDDFMLRRKPGVFVAGEMLDWEAPTGGYLLQAAFATGAAAGRAALAFARNGSPSRDGAHG